MFSRRLLSYKSNRLSIQSTYIPLKKDCSLPNIEISFIVG
nr:MAG TPA: hypothetical protein [Caudoviricetes sp.]